MAHTSLLLALAQTAPSPFADWMVWALVIAMVVLVLLMVSRRQDLPRPPR